MIIAEILLTIYLWLAGYKWFSLIPAGIGILLSIIISVSLTLAGFPPDKLNLFFIDILIIIAQIIMLGQKTLSLKKKLNQNNLNNNLPSTSSSTTN